MRRAPKAILSLGAACRAGLAGLVIAAAFAAAARAEDSVTLNIDKTGEALSQTENALDQSRRATAKLGAQVTEIRLEVLRIRRELVAGAAEAQDMEARISALEDNLQELTRRRGNKRQALARRRDELTQTFAALQRISRTPPDLLIFMPASVQDISRARLLLRAVAGELDTRTASLGDELLDLARMGDEISIQRELIDIEIGHLEAQRRRLGVLLSRKTETQNRTEAQHDRAETLVSRLADEAETLQDLLGRLEQQRFTRPEREIELYQVPAPEQAANDELVQEGITPVESVRSVTLPLAPLPAPAEQTENTSEVIVSLADDAPAVPATGTDTDSENSENNEIGPLAALAPTRPPVSASRGAFAMPARGQLVSRFDETTALGLSTKGIIIETRASAQIVAPFDGRIAFAGPFREYGLLLIIDHGEGYHTLLAGMGRIDALLDQQVLAGEPVGVMDSSNSDKPRLYVELRKRGHPINPLPWLAAESIKVSG